jgi:hypothetical protein
MQWSSKAIISPKIAGIFLLFWEVAVGLAMQKGLLDWVPDLVIAVMIVVPIFYCLVVFGRRFVSRLNKVVSFLIFVFVGTALGVFAWFIAFKAEQLKATPVAGTLSAEVATAVESKLSRLPRLSMFVDGTLRDSQTWDIIEQFRRLFHKAGHQAENVELTRDYPTPERGEIAIYLMDNPSPDLVEALTMICNGSGRKATFSKTLRGNDIRILIGPPDSPQPDYAAERQNAKTTTNAAPTRKEILGQPALNIDRSISLGEAVIMPSPEDEKETLVNMQLLPRWRMNFQIGTSSTEL